MFDHFIGLLLMGLGLRSPIATPTGEKTTAPLTAPRTRGEERSSDTRRFGANNASESGKRKTGDQKNTQPKRQEFFSRLDSLTDEQKKSIVERIDRHINEVNAKRTASMSAQLTRINELLDRAVKRLDGKDSASIDSTTTAARDAIETARVAISAQADKDYVITITAESNLGQDVRNSLSSLQADLRKLASLVDVARKAVANVIQLAGSATGEPVSTTNSERATEHPQGRRSSEETQK